MPVEFQRIKVRGCSTLIQQDLGIFQTIVSILYQNTWHRNLWNKVLVSYTNLTQWQKALSARSTKRLNKKKF